MLFCCPVLDIFLSIGGILLALEIVTYTGVASIGDFLRKSTNRGEGVSFLVPGSSDREWLKDILLANGTFGEEAFSIMRWDDLYRELCSVVNKTGLVQIDPPDHWLALHGLTGDLVDRWGDRLPPGVLQAGFVSTLGETVRELIREEISPEALKEGLFPDGEDHPEAPSWILAELYGRYSELLSERGLMDSAGISSEISGLLRAVPAASAWIRGRRWILVGFYSFTHSQLGMVRAMADAGADIAILSPVAGLTGEYGALAQLAGARSVDMRTDPPKLFSVEGSSVRHELETVVRGLALWEKGLGEMASLGDFPGWDRVGMAVQPGSLSLAVEVLNRYLIPFDRAEGRTVAETPLWDTARRSWDCLRDGWQPEATAELLCLPWMAPRADERRLVMSAPRGLKEWRRLLSGDGALSRSLEKAASFAAVVARGADCEGLLRALGNLAAGDPDWRTVLSSEVRELPGLDGVVMEIGLALQELDRKLNRIAELRFDLGEIGKRTLKGGDAMAFLSVWAESAVLWAGFSRRGTVALYGGTPPVLAHRDLWVISEATARIWPGSLAESPLLGEGQKERLHDMDLRGIRLDHTHLPLLSEKRAQREVLFRRMLVCGDGLVVVSRSTLDGAGRPLLESPFLGSAVEDGWVARVGGLKRSSGRILPSWEEAAVSPAEVHEPPPGITRARPDRRLPEEPMAVGKLLVTLSAIDEYVACPFLFRCARIWGLRAPARAGFDPALAGTALHEIWREAWRDYMEGRSASLIGLVSELWEPVLERTYRRLLTDRDLARRRERFRSELFSTAAFLESLESAGLKELRSESLTEWSLPSLEIGKVSFSGKADRVDILRDGRAFIWDYKSGNARYYRGSLQLAAYGVLLMKRGESLPLAVRGFGGYGFIGQRDLSVVGFADDDLRTSVGILSKGRTSLAEMTERAEAAMTSLASDMESGIFLPDYESRSCGKCPYGSICRRGELRNREDENDD